MLDRFIPTHSIRVASCDLKTSQTSSAHNVKIISFGMCKKFNDCNISNKPLHCDCELLVHHHSTPRNRPDDLPEHWKNKQPERWIACERTSTNSVQLCLKYTVLISQRVTPTNGRTGHRKGSRIRCNLVSPPAMEKTKCQVGYLNLITALMSCVSLIANTGGSDRFSSHVHFNHPHIHFTRHGAKDHCVSFSDNGISRRSNASIGRSIHLDDSNPSSNLFSKGVAP